MVSSALMVLPAHQARSDRATSCSVKAAAAFKTPKDNSHMEEIALRATLDIHPNTQQLTEGESQAFVEAALNKDGTEMSF